MTGDAAGAASAAGRFEGERPRLFGLAYRLLGSATDADDILREAFGPGPGGAPGGEPGGGTTGDPGGGTASGTPGNPGGGTAGGTRADPGGLTGTVTALCLDRMTYARQRRERYTGTWLPEPVLTAGGGLGPLDTEQLRESVSMAMLLLLEELTPAERAVYVLRQAFGYRYAEIAGLAGRPENACRQLFRRAAQRVSGSVASALYTPATPAESARWALIVGRFLSAGSAGDVAALEGLLAQDIASWSDGRGSDFPTAPRPIRGPARVARLFAALREVRASGATFTTAEVNASPALLSWRGDVLVAVIVPEIGYDRIRALYTIASPVRLTRLARQAAQDAGAVRDERPAPDGRDAGGAENRAE